MGRYSHVDQPWRDILGFEYQYTKRNTKSVRFETPNVSFTERVIRETYDEYNLKSSMDQIACVWEYDVRSSQLAGSNVLATTTNPWGITSHHVFIRDYGAVEIEDSSDVYVNIGVFRRMFGHEEMDQEDVESIIRHEIAHLETYVVHGPHKDGDPEFEGIRRRLDGFAGVHNR